MTEPTINPDYQLYVTRFNVMFHDYNMTEADIYAMLGPEPQKYVWPVQEVEEPYMHSHDRNGY